MSNTPDADLRAAELRTKAVRCFHMAAQMPHGSNAETLRTFGRVYLEMGERLEALDEDEMATPRRPGRA